jgi:hypothetical protein
VDWSSLDTIWPVSFCECSVIVSVTLLGQQFGEFAFLREEEGSQKRKRLIEKLVKLVDCLWERKPVYKELISMEKLKEVKRALLNSTFHFSSMYRSWIPKPNKPGKLRAITQPNKGDIIVMDALSHPIY